MPRRSRLWIWTGRIICAVIVAALVVYLTTAKLDTADKVGSCISAVLALAALGAPYLLRPPTGGDMPVTDTAVAEHTGEAQATSGGQANTGVMSGGNDRPARASNTGAARADGLGSVANSGVLNQSDGRR